MPAKPLIDYGISISLDTSNLVRGERESKKVADRLTRNINAMRKAEREYKVAVEKLNTALSKGNITKKEYNTQLARERLAVEKARNAQSRYEKQIERQTGVINKNTTAKQKNARASTRGRGFGGDLGNAAGNLASAAGLGGAVAGGARMAGLATGGGMMAGAAILGFPALLTASSFRAYAKFEDQLIRLQVLFGKGLGNKLNDEFRDLALNTALSRDAITEAAIVWRSYGLTTEGITERVRRMGEVSGGSAERMRLLATALAQVNSAGRLMGGERLQLLNAGFNMEEIAKAAGIHMSEFKKAMEEGRISAEHVNQALIAMTSEGGTHFGYLNEKAKTLNGRLEKLSETWNELLISIGDSSKGDFAWLIAQAETLLDRLTKAARMKGLIDGGPNPQQSTSDLDTGGFSTGGPIAGMSREQQVANGMMSTTGQNMTFMQRMLSSGYMGDDYRKYIPYWQGLAAVDALHGDTPGDRETMRGAYLDNQIANLDIAQYEGGRNSNIVKKNKYKNMESQNPMGDLWSGVQWIGGQIADYDQQEQTFGPPGSYSAAWGEIGSDFLGWAGSAASSAGNAALGYVSQFDLDGRHDRIPDMRDQLFKMMGLTEDTTPPAIKKIMEDRAEEIAKLDEDAKRAQISKGLGSGAVGAGSEYEYLAKSRKAQREYEEQKKRDKERNEKLKEIDEKARQALESQLQTDQALQQWLANSGSV